MKNLYAALTLAILFCGCSVLKKPDSPEKDLPALAQSSEHSIAQLGTALPAMKPGDELELKMIAAKQLTENGYWDEAVELYLEAESLAPKKPKLDLQLAPAFANAGKYAQSLQRYERILKRNPKNAAIINNYAYTLMEAGNLKKAESEFQRAIAIQPDFANASTNLGLLLAQQKRYDAALKVLVPVVGESAAYHNLGVIAVDVGDEAAAVEHFTKATSLPGSSKLSSEFLTALKKPASRIQ